MTTTAEKPAKPYTVNFTTHDPETVHKVAELWAATSRTLDSDAPGVVRVFEECKALARLIPSVAAVALVLPFALAVEEWSIPTAVLTFLATNGAVWNFRRLLAFLRKRSTRIDRIFTRNVPQ